MDVVGGPLASAAQRARVRLGQSAKYESVAGGIPDYSAARRPGGLIPPPGQGTARHVDGAARSSPARGYWRRAERLAFGIVLLALALLGAPSTSTAQATPSSVWMDEDFESYAVGSLPDDYVIVYNGQGNSAQRIEQGANGNQYLRTAGQRGWSLDMRKDFDEDFPDAVTVRLRMRANKDVTNNLWWGPPPGLPENKLASLASFGIKNASEGIAGVGIVKKASDGKIYLTCGDAKVNREYFAREVQIGVWVEFELDIDFAKQTVSMRADGEPYCVTSTGRVDLSYTWNAWGEGAGIMFWSGNANATETLFDDVVIVAGSDPPQRSATPSTLPFFLPASSVGRESFARIINHSDESGTVDIYGLDDAGREYGPVSLALEARETAHFVSGDLERGNAAKGLSGGLGSGEGNWRLRLETDLDVEALAYIRTADEFLTSMHDVVGEARGDAPFPGIGSNALASYGRFHVIAHDLSEDQSHDAECKAQLGSGVRLADWNDIVGYYEGGGSLEDFVAGVRMSVDGQDKQPGELGSGYRISRNGEPIWSGRRHYFFARHDHRKPSHFLAHAHIDNYHLSLGSWYGTGGYALCHGVEDDVRNEAGHRWHVPIFNPGSNLSVRSWLRLINPTAQEVEVTIRGRDSAGMESAEEVRLSLGAGESHRLSAQALESGGGGFSGRLGDGQGKWQLFVTATGPIEVMSLLDTGSGHLTNLSTSRDSGDDDISFFLPASSVGRESFARIINHSDASGAVDIYGIDDAGREYGPISLALEAREAAHFSSGDLERGNAAKGLSGGLGTGEGSWRLRLETDLDIEALAYVRTADGFLTSMHDVVHEAGGPLARADIQPWQQCFETQSAAPHQPH